jgi:DNA-binding transcriptional LysR family regulator
MAIFARVVEAGSFSRAAQRLNVSKSVVSKHITDLERALGAQLVVRTTRSVMVTEAGREFYERCAEILHIAEQAELEASKLHATPRGVLRVVAPISLGTLEVSRALPGLLATHRELEVDLVLSNRATNLIEEGFDASVTVGTALPPGMVARRVATLAQRLCAARSYLTHRGAPAAPADLRAHNCLLAANSASERKWTFRSRAGASVSVTVSGNLRINNLNALRMAARGGAGIALLPGFVADADVAQRILAVVLPDWTPPPLAVHVVYPPGRNVAPKIRAFVDCLTAWFAAREPLRDVQDVTIESREDACESPTSG